MPAKNLLDITLIANDGTNHVYISSNTSLNVLTLTLTNTSTESLVFQQYSGSDCSIGALASTETGIYLLFNGMLANSEISAITCNKPGWTLFSFSDNRNGTYLVLTSQSNVQLPAGESLSFELQLPAISGSGGSGYLLCQCVNLQYTNPISYGQQLYITKVYPPRTDGTAAAQLPIQFEFIGGNTVYSGQNNQQLVFRITNTSAEALVPGGSSSWGTATPQFRLSFIEDEHDSPGSFMTHTQAGGVAVNTLELYGNSLQVTPELDDSPVNWLIDDDQTNTEFTGTVLGTGASASVTFSITSISTQVPPSVTMAILSYSGFPGYPDGQVTAEIVILNAPPLKPVVNHFTITPSVVNIMNLRNIINLSWNVSNASNVVILHENSVITNTTYTNASTTVSVTQTTTFTLIASNTAGEEVVRNVTIQVDTVPIGTIMMWSATYLSLPAGWYVCDGGTYNGKTTPDLRDRFIYGADQKQEAANPPTSNTLGQTGGSNQHNHSFTVSDVSFTVTGGNHSHYINFNGSTAVQSGDSNHNGNNYYHGDNGDDSIEYTDGSSDGAHSHTVTADSHSHQTATASSMPPYYTLYFVMKCE